MPLTSTTLLSPHFTARELGADLPNATDVIIANLRQVAAYLELIRATLSAAAGWEVQLKVVSGLRTSAHNTEVGGSPTSNHLDGKAADFVPLNTKRPPYASAMTMYRANRILRDAIAAGTLPAFDQLIYYPLDGHLHIGLGTRQRGETLIRIAEQTYVPLTDDLLKRLPGFADALAQVGSSLSATVGNQLSWFPVFAMVLLFLVVFAR